MDEMPRDHRPARCTRVLLAEDQGMVRGALALLLGMEADLEVVAQVGAGDEVVRTALTTRPDVALLDIELPGRSGLEAAADLRAECPECRVVILTTFGRPGDLRRAMEAGAVGFLVKDGPVGELAEAIRAVLRGETVVDPALAAAELGAGPGPFTGREAEPLTGREADVLAAAGDGVAVADIASALRLSEAAVREHLSAAIGKTGARGRTEAVREARHRGWL
ncbi:response regulator [Streptomyces sp. NPDC017941]|uniref:response regulator n=1 Tax=Streptomyces sp. NPDC017941 TaxID=3365018 RepID=UPI0037BA06D5